MTPRWAQKLEAQANPTPSAHDQLWAIRLVLAVAGICVPIGLTGAKAAVWAMGRLEVDLRAGAVVTIAALFAFILSALLVTARNLGGRAVRFVILPALSFFGAFAGALLFETFR